MRLASLGLPALIALGYAAAGCGSNPAAPAPVAVLSIASAVVAPGAAVSFDASRSTGSGLSYSLAYGDGASDGPQASPAFAHIYRSAGAFKATLTVRDQRGAAATDVKDVAVAAPLSACGQVLIDGAPGDVAQAPQTKLTAIRDSSGVTVDASCSTGVGLSYAVTWGDGGTAGPQSNAFFGEPHIYRALGSFTVTVVVRDQSGVSASFTGTVPVLDFTGRWVNTVFNPSNGRNETRFLQLTQGANKTISGSYTHPEGNSEPLTGSINGLRGVNLRLVSGTIAFYADDSGSEQLSTDGRTIVVEVAGGSANGMRLTFTRM